MTENIMDWIRSAPEGEARSVVCTLYKSTWVVTFSKVRTGEPPRCGIGSGSFFEEAVKESMKELLAIEGKSE